MAQFYEPDLGANPDDPFARDADGNQYIYSQIIDDEQGVTLAAASDLESDLRSHNGPGKTDRATAVGVRLAERARATGIRTVVFDRGGYRYHGRGPLRSSLR